MLVEWSGWREGSQGSLSAARHSANEKNHLRQFCGHCSAAKQASVMRHVLRMLAQDAILINNILIDSARQIMLKNLRIGQLNR